MRLHTIPKSSGSKRKAKRIGRGYGSGKGGHTTIRGQKGQKSRGKVKPWFEGGQKPLVHRLPHRRGLKAKPQDRVCFNLDQIDKLYEKGETVSLESLLQKGALRGIPTDGVKILGRGQLSKKLNFNRDLLLSRSVSQIVQQ